MGCGWVVSDIRKHRFATLKNVYCYKQVLITMHDWFLNCLFKGHQRPFVPPLERRNHAFGVSPPSQGCSLAPASASP